MGELAARTIYEFSGFRLDSRKRLLFSGDRPVPLSPRAFDTLIVLVDRAGETLEKSELLKRVWPKTIVEENSLNQNISQLRRALGERPGEHRFIVTRATMMCSAPQVGTNASHSFATRSVAVRTGQPQ